jgi:hypothetical protein
MQADAYAVFNQLIRRISQGRADYRGCLLRPDNVPNLSHFRE